MTYIQGFLLYNGDIVGGGEMDYGILTFDEPTRDTSRKIIHIDMDAFYASLNGVKIHHSKVSRSLLLATQKIQKVAE